MKVIIASSNKGKIAEFQDLLDSHHLELVAQTELGVDDADETGKSFIENALIKARHAAAVTNMPAIADDSGLAVAALNGQPGIFSARYAGANANAADNIQKLLANLQGLNSSQRQASFHCAIAFVLHADDPTPLICEGKWDGIIAQKPKGENGFGYDPVFFIPALNKTAAELSREEKNRFSHRHIALQAFIRRLNEKLL